MSIFSSQKNRNFSTLDLFMLVALVGGVGSVFGVVLAQAFQDERPMRARMSAENLARQIEANVETRRSEKSQASRAPASVSDSSTSSATAPVLTEGTLGKDPWGRPFHYLVRAPKVFVWSDGANGREESKLGASLVLGGDDIGHSRSLRASN